MKSGFGELLRKSGRVFREDGVKGFLVKTKNYLVFRVKTAGKHGEVRDILFINGCALPHPERYRVDHQVEQLEANGLTVDKIFYENIDLEKLKFYRGFVFFRCPITSKVKEFIDRAHYFNKTVFFDIDDLVIDKKYTDEIEYVQKMSVDERKLYDDGVNRMGETMRMCDHLITTTSALARELRHYNESVFINKNVASEEMVKLSLTAQRNVIRNSDRVVIGYLSGSITHNPDFDMVKPALIKIMDEFKNVELCVMGHLDLPSEFERFGDRIIRKPFGDWKKLPEIIAGLDINLAPIEKSIFNEAKSENKWTEAALCGVVTVASDFGAFKDVIDDGVTGVLCSNGEDWYVKLKDLIEHTEKRRMIGEAAKAKAMKEYITTYSGLPLAKFIESKLARNIAFVLPSTNISGGVNVVLRHCDILRRHGLDVMVINMDRSDDNFVNELGEVNVVSGVRHDILARFNAMVATLYTTLDYVKKYPEVRRKMYLVQNFETNFGEYGKSMKREANATYNAFDDVEYITISRWCKEWLENDFGKEVKYAPNGIDLKLFEFKQRKFSGKIKILVEGNSDDYYKNVDESFKVVEKLDKDRYEVTYLSYQGVPKKWYRVDKFYHRVPHDEVTKIYGSCDILLKSSILESFSYPPLEMMATGGYAVVVPNDGNREYLKDGENCLFYNQGDVDMAVRKIEEIVQDATLRAKLSKNAKATVTSREWSDIEDKILDLYE